VSAEGAAEASAGKQAGRKWGCVLEKTKCRRSSSCARIGCRGYNDGDSG
jgi:hypothetical protein